MKPAADWAKGIVEPSDGPRWLAAVTDHIRAVQLDAIEACALECERLAEIAVADRAKWKARGVTYEEAGGAYQDAADCVRVLARKLGEAK